VYHYKQYISSIDLNINQTDIIKKGKNYIHFKYKYKI